MRTKTKKSSWQVWEEASLEEEDVLSYNNRCSKIASVMFGVIIQDSRKGERGKRGEQFMLQRRDTGWSSGETA